MCLFWDFFYRRHLLLIGTFLFLYEKNGVKLCGDVATLWNKYFQKKISFSQFLTLVKLKYGENFLSSVKILFLSVKILFLSVDLLFLSVKILFLSVEILFLSVKILFLSVKILFLSVKILFLSVDLLFLSGIIETHLFLYIIFQTFNRTKLETN